MGILGSLSKCHSPPSPYLIANTTYFDAEFFAKDDEEKKFLKTFRLLDPDGGGRDHVMSEMKKRLKDERTEIASEDSVVIAKNRHTDPAKSRGVVLQGTGIRKIKPPDDGEPFRERGQEAKKYN